MKKLNNDQLKMIEGGAISGTIVSAFKGVFTVLADIGRSLGSGIRRIQTKNMCVCK